MYIVIPDAANASGARVGKEKERKTKDDVEEKAVPSPENFRTTFSPWGCVVFLSCE
jgi:hypothetical protein